MAAARLIVEPRHDRVDLGIQRLDARDRGVQQLGRAHLAAAHQLGQPQSVVARELLGLHRPTWPPPGCRAARSCPRGSSPWSCRSRPRGARTPRWRRGRGRRSAGSPWTRRCCRRRSPRRPGAAASRRRRSRRSTGAKKYSLGSLLICTSEPGPNFSHASSSRHRYHGSQPHVPSRNAQRRRGWRSSTPPAAMLPKAIISSMGLRPDTPMTRPLGVST